MKNIELLKLEGKLQNQAVIDLLEHDNYLEANQINEILALGESGLQDMRVVMRAYLDNIEAVKKSINTLCPFYHIQSFMTHTRDEASFDLMMEYIKSDYQLLEDTFSDSIFEDLVVYPAFFPNRLTDLEKELYNKSTPFTTKELIAKSIYIITTLPENQKFNQQVLDIYQNHLRFLSIPENRKDFCPPPKKHEWVNLNNYLAFLISNTYNQGGDVKQDYIYSLFEQKLVDEGIFGTIEDLVKTSREKHDYYNDIYQRNLTWKMAVEREIAYKKELEEWRQKQAILQKIRTLSQNYGRNDKVTVRYIDGKIVNDVKFKKVEDDIKAGKCEII